jgi:hypothetical protein
MEIGGGNGLMPHQEGLDVRKNSTGTVLSRPRLNLIEGGGTTLTVADDAGNEEIDVTIAVSAVATVTTAVRTTDSATKAADTTLANDTELLFPINGVSTEMWLVEAYLLVAAANATMDIKIGWSAPSGATASWGALGNMAEVQGFGARVAANTLPNALLAISGTPGYATISGTSGLALTGIFFDGGTSGNVNLQWAQNTSDAGTLFLRKGSCLRLTKLN